MIGMMSAAFTYNNPSQVNRVNNVTVPVHHHIKRPSLKFSFPSGASNILNSAVIHAAGRSLYSVSSNTRRTTILSCRGNVIVATVQWDRRSPRMVFRQKKMKCKKWLKLAEHDNESRTLTHGDAQFTWKQGQGSASCHLIPANRPGLEIAPWQIKPGTNELVLEVFEESPVESGLLDAIVLSIVLLRSGHSLGDSQAQPFWVNPFYSLTVLGLMGESLKATEVQGHFLYDFVAEDSLRNSSSV